MPHTVQSVLDETPPTKDSLRIRLQALNVRIPRVKEVEEYIADHADLALLIEQSSIAMRASFGPQVELSLEMYHDPEQSDKYLALYLRQDKYEPGIIDRIDSVASALMNDLETNSGDLVITTDFSRPRG